MHYYQKNIGDFNNATRHLTRVERSLFSDAIELYYDTEKPLVSDLNKLNRLLLAHSQEEKDALLVVLAEFFTLTEEGYFNKRCNEEIVKYQAYMESKSRAGKASAEQRANKKATSVEHVLNTTPTNHKPITNNHNNIYEPNGSLCESNDSNVIDVKHSKKTKIPITEIVNLYHKNLPMCPKVEIITSKRKGQIGARWNSGELDTLQSWEDFFIFCKQSKFLIGGVEPVSGRRRFIANLEWLTKESSYTKIIEGQYHGT